MTWAVPTWYELVLLALAAFRTFQLIANDTILDRPRARLEQKMPKGEEFITCPWCAGAYISLAWWVAWLAWPHGTLVVAALLAIMVVLALVASHVEE